MGKYFKFRYTGFIIGAFALSMVFVFLFHMFAFRFLQDMAGVTYAALQSTIMTLSTIIILYVFMYKYGYKENTPAKAEAQSVPAKKVLLISAITPVLLFNIINAATGIVSHAYYTDWLYYFVPRPSIFRATVIRLFITIITELIIIVLPMILGYSMGWSKREKDRKEITAK